MVIRVNTAARNSTSSTRCISSACDEVSSATCVQPGVADAGELRLQLRRLRGGLSRRVGDHVVAGAPVDGGDRRGGDPGRAPRVPEERRRGGLAVGPGDARRRRARGSGGRGRRRRARRAPACASATMTTGYRRRRAAASGRRSATTATAPRATASRDESMAVGAQPGDGDEEAARASPSASRTRSR